MTAYHVSEWAEFAKHRRRLGRISPPKRARRALDRGEFEEADFFLRIADALAPGSAAVKRLRDGLHEGRTARESFTYRALRELTS